MISGTEWLQIGSDALIALGCLFILTALLYFARKRTDLGYGRALGLFAGFIFAIGLLHLVEIWTVWNPNAGLEAGLKLLTGALSITAAVLFVSFLPRIMALPSPAQLEDANQELRRQVRERERAEADLSWALGETAMIMETVPDIICMVDLQGRIVRWNKRAEEVSGFSADEIAGREAVDFFPADQAEIIREGIAQAIAKGYSEIEVDLRRRDGSSVTYHFAGVPVSNASGEVIGVTTIGRDVSERKQAERLSASLKEKEVLLRELHHRVKNNLQVITSLLSLQSGYVRDPEALEMFKESQNRVRLMAMVHEALYRSDSLSRLDGDAFIRDIARTLQRAYGIGSEVAVDVQAAGVTMEIETAVPCGLIINELVSNALKHAFQNGRRGTISVRLDRDGQARYVLSVEDNGVGVPDLGRWNQPRTLGWQLVQALADQLGGTVELESGEGTRFVLTFPAQRQA